jgi:hypothetical protein
MAAEFAAVEIVRIVLESTRAAVVAGGRLCGGKASLDGAEGRRQVRRVDLQRWARGGEGADTWGKTADKRARAGRTIARSQLLQALRLWLLQAFLTDRTLPLPPPPVVGFMASPPTSTNFLIFVLSRGSRLPLFLSRTVACSESCLAAVILAASETLESILL